MATIPTKKISEITTLLSDLTKETLVAVAEDDGAGGYVTKKVDLRDIDDVQGYTDFASFPGTGKADTLYIDKAASTLYYWDGAAYAELGLSAGEILARLKTVDGDGSGLDADKLDGNDSTYYTDADNHVYDSSSVQLTSNTTQGAITEVANIIHRNSPYGIRWDYVNDVIQPGILVNGNFLATDYSSFPIQEQMCRGLLDNVGTFKKLKADDSSKWPDGTSAPIDGSGGNIHVQIPAYAFLTYAEGNYHYVFVNDDYFGFKGTQAWVPPMFGDRNKIYIGAFEGTAMSDAVTANVGSVINAVHNANGLDTSAYTISYPAPFTNRTKGDFRNQCNYDYNFQYAWGLHDILMALFVTEYKTFNSQAVLPGHTWRASFNYADTTKPGETYTLGNSSGSIGTLGSETSNSFRGVENFYGNVWKWVDGININNIVGAYDVYVCFDPANFADDTSTNYQILSGTTDFADSDGYMSNLLMNASKYGSFYPTAINGSSSEYVHDYMWDAAGGWRVLASGGTLQNGAQAGVAALSAAASSGDLSYSLGARLAGYV